LAHQQKNQENFFFLYFFQVILDTQSLQQTPKPINTYYTLFSLSLLSLFSLSFFLSFFYPPPSFSPSGSFGRAISDRPKGKRVAALDKNIVIFLYASSTIFSKDTKEKNFAFSKPNKPNKHKTRIIQSQEHYYQPE
ncbi:hypothetical protein PHYBLDRAFT_77310, partial [Phycomyces blakesleeanus NRRL 1555(-)]